MENLPKNFKNSELISKFKKWGNVYDVCVVRNIMKEVKQIKKDHINSNGFLNKKSTDKNQVKPDKNFISYVHHDNGEDGKLKDSNADRLAYRKSKFNTNIDKNFEKVKDQI